jgi:hypothetical protein
MKNVARDARRIVASETKYMREKEQDILGHIIKQTQRLQKNLIKPQFCTKYENKKEIGCSI